MLPKLALFSWLGILFLWFLPPVSLAAEKPQGTLSVSPAYREVTLTNPDEEQDISITYTNSSEKPLTLQMFPLDFAHKDAYGTIGLVMPQQGAYAYGLASYLSLQSDTITIEPKESHTFHVKIKNRIDLSPGGHYGAVIGKVISPDGRNMGAQVAPSVSSLIFLNKSGGERYNLSLKSVDWGNSLSFSSKPTALLQFQNEGNIHLVPYGTLEVRDMFGRLTHSGVLNTSSFMVMPQSRRYMTVQVRRVAFSFPVSFNTLTVKGNDSLHKTRFVSRTTSVTINPWFMILFIAALILISIWLLRRLKLNKTKIVQSDAKLSRKRHK